MTKPGYRPEIDGLRAIAVLAVVAFHLGIGVPGGFVGVDVFFVISGFLIAGIIRRGLEDGTFSLAEFWERRIRRILPAAIVVVTTTIACGYWLLTPSEYVRLGKSSVAQTMFQANLHFLSRSAGYFTGAGEMEPLLHTWSLAVEEQFYLLLPLVLVFSRRLRREQLCALLSVAAVGSLCVAVLWTSRHPMAAFYLLPSRTWEFLVGCVLAVSPWRPGPSPGRRGAIASVGFAAIVAPMFLYDARTPFPGFAAIPPVLGTAMVVLSTENAPTNSIRRLLSFDPLVFVGLMSYSLYLWHWPVIVYTHMYFSEFGGHQVALASVLSFGLAAVSWRFVETPVRQYAPTRRTQVFATAVVASLAVVLVGAKIVTSGGWSARFPNKLLADTRYPGARYAITPHGEFDFESLPRVGLEPRPSTDSRPLDFVVWGDSHGMMLCPGMDHAARRLGLSGRAAVWGGQVPGPNLEYKYNSPEFSSALLNWMSRRRTRNLVLVNRWSTRMNGPSGVGDRVSTWVEPEYVSDDRQVSTSYEDSAEVLRRSLARLASTCEEHDITLWIIEQVPEIDEDSPARDVLMYSMGRVWSLPASTTTLEDHRRRQAVPNQVFESLNSPVLRIVDPAPYLFDENGRVRVVENGRSRYYDDDHLTTWGTGLVSPLFVEMFTEMRRDAELESSVNAAARASGVDE